jgi:hypothetical protein
MLLLCFAAAACSGGGGGGQVAAITPVSPPAAPPPPPPPPAPPSFSNITTSTQLSGPQAGVTALGSSTSATVTQWDGSSIQVTYNPSASSSSPLYSITAALGSTTASAAFKTSDVTTFVNPLTNGANPRATGGQTYGVATSSSRVDVMQTFDLRRTAGAAAFSYAHLLQYAYASTAGVGSGLSEFVVYGFPTTVANMPATGSGTWTGVGTGVYVGALANSDYDFLGDASLSVNFASKSVSGAINNMSYYANGALTSSPPDRMNQIALSGTISGAQFSGTALVDFNVQSDISAPMRGQFFGPNNGAPVEAGGVFSGSGSAGAVYGGFVVGAP